MIMNMVKEGEECHIVRNNFLVALMQEQHNSALTYQMSG